MNLLPKKAPLYILLASSLVFSSGCAYYNSFFNAKKAYNKAMDEVEKASDSKKLPAPTIASFNLAIQKASKVLQDHSKSRWADDALHILGNSYYYTGDNQKSKQAFDDLFNNFPKSSLIPESRLLYAQIHLEENSYDLAEIAYEKLIADPKTPNEFKRDAYFGLASLLFFRGDYSGAVTQYSNLLQSETNRVFKAETQLKIAESYKALLDYEKAAEGFKNVLKYEPDVETKYLSSFGYGTSLTALKEYDKAVAHFRSMLKREEFIDNYTEMYIEIARSWELKGEKSKAVAALAELNEFDPNSIRKNRIGAADSTAQQTNTATDGNAQALFYLAQIYYKQDNNFVEAKAKYAAAAKAKPTPEMQKTIAEKLKYITEIEKLYKVMEKTAPSEPVLDFSLDSLEIEVERMLPFARNVENIAFTDTMLIMNPDPTKMSLVVDSTKIRLLAQLKGMKNKVKFKAEVDSSALASVKIITAPEAYLQEYLSYLETLDAYRAEKAGSAYRLAEIYDIELENPDSSVVYLKTIVDSIPHEDFAAKALLKLYRLAEKYELNGAEDYKQQLSGKYGSTTYASSLSVDRQDTETMATPTTVIDSVDIYFKKAQAYLFEERDFENSLQHFDWVLKNASKAAMKAKALYNKAWIYENKLFDNDRALKSYQMLKTEFGATEYGRKAVVKIGEWETAKKEMEKKRENARILMTLRVKQRMSELPDSLKFVYLDSILAIDSLRVMLPDSLINLRIDTSTVLIDTSQVSKNFN